MLERPFWYSGAFALSANQVAQDLRIPIRQNADFYLRGLQVRAASGAVGGRFRRADSSWFTSSDFMHLSGFCITDNFWRPTPIGTQIRYPANSAFVFDLQDLGGAGDTEIFPVLTGVERYPDSGARSLPANYTEYPHSILASATVTGAGAQVLRIPIRCKTGDVFAVRSIRWTATGTAPASMHVRLWDEQGAGFMNDWVPLRQWAAAGSNNDANQPFPATVFPEMVIPANGGYWLDFFNKIEAGPFTVEITFSGVRLVGVAEQAA